MKNLNARPIRLTTAQFAQLHGINKRTLHYYDAIGLFSPIIKAITTTGIMTIPRV